MSAMNSSEFIEKYATHPNYQSPTGNELHARSWQTEAPLRMLLNNLDRRVAENPEELVVYGGTGQAARNPEALRQIINCLLDLDGRVLRVGAADVPIPSSAFLEKQILPTTDDVVQACVFGSDRSVVQARGNRVRERDLAVVVLEDVGLATLEDAEFAPLEPGGMVTATDAAPAGFHTGQTNRRLIQKFEEGADRV